MKSAFVRSLIAVLFCVCVRLALAGDFHSATVAAGTPLVLPAVPANHFIRIRNFTQDTPGLARGTVSVVLGSGGTSTTVLTAALTQTGSASAPERINSIVIAGPATVTITAAASTTAFITYIKQSDSD